MPPWADAGKSKVAPARAPKESPFSASYASSRVKFLALNACVAVLGGNVTSRPLAAAATGPITGSEGEELALDFAVLGDTSAPCQSLYLLTAGQHGVDGFVGSAIQCELLHTLTKEKVVPPKGVWIIAVHVINPYGMSWSRVFNEDNVDLNRNFLPDGLQGSPQTYADRNRQGASDMYKKLDPLLNPASVGCCDCFCLKAWFASCRYGKAAMKQAPQAGQPDLPGNLFYSGNAEAASTTILTDFLIKTLGASYCDTLRRVIHNDIHVGPGSSGHDTVKVISEAMKVKVIDALGGEHSSGPGGCFGGGGPGTFHVENVGPDGTVGKQPAATAGAGTDGGAGAGAGQSLYAPTGNIMDGLMMRLSPSSCDWLAMSQEFGTCSSTKILQVLRAENALHHVATDAPGAVDQHAGLARARAAVKSTYYPASTAWRAGCLARGMDVSMALIGGLGAATEKTW